MDKKSNINKYIYYVLILILVISNVLSFILDIYAPDEDLTIKVKDTLKNVTKILQIYASLYIVIMFNPINGKRDCDTIDIEIIYHAGLSIFIVTLLPTILNGLTDFFVIKK